MTVDLFKRLLKSRRFISTNSKNQHFPFRFTEAHVFRDDQYLSDYTLIEQDGNIKMTIQNLNPKIWDDFTNVLFVIDNEKIIINHNPVTFKGNYFVILTAE